MRIALIADAFPPLRSSGAVQLRDLAREFARQGHEVTVLVPAPSQRRGWTVEERDGLDIVRLKAPRTKGTNHLRRLIGEFLMPFAMLRNYRASPLAGRRFDGIVWYSPTIFLGPIVKALKRESRCPTYLIIRDIFPEWAADMGLMGRGGVYRLLKAVADFQYSLADTIGVQTPGNLAFFERWQRRAGTRLEVLHNWLTELSDSGCSIDLATTSFAGRRIFVYAGNMGLAQGTGRLLDLAEQLQGNDTIGFVFVGRGDDTARLREDARRRRLMNVLFYDEIDPDEMTGLYRQCSLGLVALDPRHTTHNIPGKFISYMHAGLPVLASVNPGNDMATLVASAGVGRVSEDPTGANLKGLALAMMEDELLDPHVTDRCTTLARQLFSSETAAAQIIRALSRQ